MTLGKNENLTTLVRRGDIIVFMYPRSYEIIRLLLLELKIEYLIGRRLWQE